MTIKRHRHYGEQRDCMESRSDGQYVLFEEHAAELAEERRLCTLAIAGAGQCGEILKEAEAKVVALEAALRKIAAYPPGDFRPLADEIAIWKIATEAVETELPLSPRAEQGIIDQCFPAETKCPPCQIELGGKRCADCGYAPENSERQS